MKILMINKFLHPKGGAETYVFRLGNGLEAKGHEVQYFGMEHEERCVGNAVDQYTSTMDFHGGSRWARILYPIKTIYSREARRKIRKVLDDFKPDVCHLNNFNYQLTPSMILEIVKWRKENHRDCKIVFTAHDYQLLCPNHMMNNPNSHENCDKCVNRQFYQCAKEKCIHRSFARSLIGMAEAYFWNFLNVYRYMDVIICCSEFMKQQMDRRPLYADKTVVLHNFTDPVQRDYKEKKDYVLYFGRYSEEKGISTLLKVSKELPDIPFVLAGSGPLEQQVSQVEHVKNMGFLSGEALKKLIQEARFSIYPSDLFS